MYSTKFGLCSQIFAVQLCCVCHLQTLAAAAVVASAINIGGGFTITQRMLNMFKRPGDPTEHNYLYGIPAAVLMGGYAAGWVAGAQAPAALPASLHVEQGELRA